MNRSIKQFVAMFAGITAVSTAVVVRADAPAVPGDPFDRPALTTVTDYPAFEVRAVPVAKARAVQTRLEFNRSLETLTSVARQAWQDLYNGKEFLEAANAERIAYDDFVSARKQALRSLNENPRYLALLKLRDDLKNKISALEDSRSANAEQIQLLATLKLSYAQSAGDLERELLADDKIYRDARNKLLDAGNKTAAMRAQFAGQVRKNADFVAARKSAEDSRIAYLTADAFYQGTKEARYLSLRYAYSLHEWDKYQYLNGGDYGYYNTGYRNYTRGVAGIYTPIGYGYR